MLKHGTATFSGSTLDVARG